MENVELNQNNEEIETEEKKDLFYEASDYVLSESPKIIERINNGENGMLFTFAEQAYIASGKPREKRIEELEQQIEKMKCCYNCSKWNDGQCADIPDSVYCCADFVCDEWEIKENDIQS